MALSKLAVRRLTKLADYIMTVPREHFDMGAWVQKYDADVGLIPFHSDVVTATCGTSACAIGWATAIPAFKKAGLRAYVIPEKRDLVIICDRKPKNAELKAYRSNENSAAAAARFFNISFEDAEYLFWSKDSMGIESPKQWSRMCRKFLKENAK